MTSVLWRRPTVKWAAALQVAFLSIAGILVTANPAAAVNLPGVVLLSSTATLPAELSPLATGKRITYVTTTLNGSLTTATGLVLTPKTGKKNRTVVWAHGTTGLADKCAPSTNQAVFWPEAKAAISALLAKGWTVAAPDYPGLGTAQPHPYLIGQSAARSAIDSVKAARNLDSALSTQYVLDGHSQGGQAVLFGGQIAPSYDGNLVLRGVVSIAPVSNAQDFIPLVPGSPGGGYLVMALYGLQAQDPSFDPNTVLAAPARQRTAVLQSECLYQILDAYDDLTAEQLVVGGALPQPLIDRMAQFIDPARAAPSAPIYLVQGTADEAVPYFLTGDLLLDQLDDYQQPVTFVPVAGANHDDAVFATTQSAADWIATRFT